MPHIAKDIRTGGGFLRRRDLLAIGYTDGYIRAALRHRMIFRVRQGWYSVPDAPDAAVRAVRVGGRLTGVAALESYGLRVPRRAQVDIAVPSWARRLRNPAEMRERLAASDGIRPHWTDRPIDQLDRQRDDSSGRLLGVQSRWRVTVDDALLVVLRTEGRDIAVACCSAVMHKFRWGEPRMDAVFRRAPQHTWRWRTLVDRRDEAHGETFARLWFRDAGILFESQPVVPGVGRLDGRIGTNVYVEIDGGQHDAAWTGDGTSSFHPDHVRDLEMARRGKWVLRFDYAQLYGDWAACLAAAERAIADDNALIAYRRRHPYRPRSPGSRGRARESVRVAFVPNENDGDRSS